MLVCINEEEPWILSEFGLKTERHTKVKNCISKYCKFVQHLSSRRVTVIRVIFAVISRFY